MWPPYRVSSCNDPFDQVGDLPVHFHVGLGTGRILVCSCGVAQHPHDLMLGKNFLVVQCQQKRFTDRERRHSGIVSLIRHLGYPFQGLEPKLGCQSDKLHHNDRKSVCWTDRKQSWPRHFG
jgi:hypothetical protein